MAPGSGRYWRTCFFRPNEVVSSDRLIGELWGDDAPPAARNVLQSYVSYLRRSVGKERFEGRAGGHLIRVDPAEVDSYRSRNSSGRARKVTTDDPEAAAEHYRSSLALWRGPALDDPAVTRCLRPRSCGSRSLGSVQPRN